jgi:hypothetical protein
MLSKRPRAWCIHVLAPTVTGGLIYVLFRDRSLLVFSWIDAIGLGDLTTEARAGVQGFTLPAFVRYSLPDGMWVYATTSWMSLLWSHPRPISALPWMFCGIALGAGGELGQLVGLIPGTFDSADLLACFAGFAASIALTFGRNNE